MKKWMAGILGLLMVIAISSVGFTQEYFPPPRDNSGIIGGRAGEAWSQIDVDKIVITERTAPSGNPPTNHGWIYVKDKAGTSALYFENDAGSASEIGPLAWDDIADPDANSSITLGTYTNIFTGAATAANQNQFLNTGNMGDVAIVYIQQLTGTPTDGKLLYGTMASDLVDGIQIYSSDTDIAATGQVLLRLDFKDDDDTDGYFIVARDNNSADTEFSVDMVGNIVGTKITVAGTALDINSLDFVGAGGITTAAGTALTLAAEDGATAGEDLIITANNISLTAVGLLTLKPDAALAIAIDASDTDIATALSVGANDIVGTTGLINYTNFDVDAAGAVVCTALNAGAGTIQTTGDITATGTITGGTISGTTILQDAIVAKTSPRTLTLDGTGTGGVAIGTVSGTGTITLGGGGFATLVNLPATVDLTLAGGQLSITDTANADVVAITNNTLTTADGIQLTLGGARTSGAGINIVDSATTASSISITAAAATSAKLISVTADALDTGTMLYLASGGIPASTYYIQCYDGAANDFLVGANGATTISGNASTNVLTVTAGDVQIDDGLLEIDTDEDDQTYIKRNQGATSKAAFKVWEAAAAADSPAIQIVQDATAAGSYGLEIDSAGGTSIHLAANGAAGIHTLMDAADAWTGQAIVIDAGPWLGTLNRGVIDFRSDSAATAEVGHVIYVKMQGTAADAAAIDGKGLYIEDEAGSTAGSYLAKLDTKSNTALHISNSGAAADGIKFDVADSYTGQGILVDAGPWLGTVGEGFFQFQSDNAATTETGQVIRINLRATGVDAAAISGKGLYIKDTAAATASSYLVHIESTNNGAMNISGDMDIALPANDDFIYVTSTPVDYAAGAGVITVYDTAAAGWSNASYLLRLVHEANADAQNNFILCEDASTGAAGNGTDLFAVDYAGSVVMAGSLTVNGPQIVGDGATEMVGVKHDVVDAGATNPYTVTAAMSGTVFTNSQASHFDLPAAASGLEYIFVVMHASALVIDPDAADTIMTGGAAGASISSSTVGDTITLVGSSDAMWAVKSVYPASTDWVNE